MDVVLKRRALCGLTAGLWAAGSEPAAAGPPLRFAVGQSWGPPFLERIGSRVIGGLLPDLMTAIAAELGVAPAFELLPALRVEQALRNGDVDLHCLLSPSWWPELLGSPRWSVPVLPLRDVLVAARSGPNDAAAYAAGARWRLALVRGYQYPTLDSDLSSGRLRREDAPDQWSVLEMLARDHAQLGVVNEYTLRTFVQRHERARVHLLRLVEETQGHCLIGERPAYPPALIHAAIRRLVQSGRLEQVLEPYR